MMFVSITVHKVFLKQLKQGIGCLLKGFDKIMHIISNHIRGIVICITGNINVIYNKKNKSAKKALKKMRNSGLGIEPCRTSNIVSN